MKCCYGCTEETGRKLGCHGTCERYLAEVEANRAIKAEQRKDAEYVDYMARKNNRCK
jgi:hypothetical protein